MTARTLSARSGITTLKQLKQSFNALIAPTRLWDWWEFKTPVFLGVAYLVGVESAVPLQQLAPALIKLVIALVPVASFVSVINDISDEGEDQRAGKSNTVAGRSTGFKATWVALCLAGGLLGGWMLIASPIAVLLYLANWVVFTLYSIPPVRLKTRGIWGVLADACGGQLLPTLWTTFGVAALGPGSLAPGLGWALGTWALALGLRAILAHQAADLANDQKSGTPTLAVRLGADRVKRLVRYGIFPVEVIALGWLLLQVHSPLVWGVALAFLLAQGALAQLKAVPLVLVVPQRGCWLLLFRYYFTLFPLAFVPQLAQQSAWVWLLIPVHVVLFPGSWGISLKALTP